MILLRKARSAFTLAEVLITLAVIGIVAAMGIPSLMSSTEDSEYRSALRKAQAVLSQSLVLIYGNGAQFWDMSDKTATSRLIRNEFAQYMNVAKSGQIDDIVPAGFYSLAKTYGGSVITHVFFEDYNYAIQSNDGVIYLFKSGHDTHLTTDGRGYYAEIDVDLNGMKGPNQLGRDMHHFYVVGNNANQLQILPGGFPSSHNEYGGQGCSASSATIYSSIACSYYMLFEPEMP